MKRANNFWTPTLILATCLALLMSLTAQAQTTTDHTITTSGSGSVAAVPDQAELSFTIEQQGNKLTSLKTQVDQISQRLNQQLLNKGIAERHIRSLQLSVYPRYETKDGERQQVGFVVRRNVEVTLTDLEHYDSIVDLALAQGVTRIGQLQFTVSNQAELYQQALQLAYKNAQQKAQFLADSAELTLGSALSISEQSSSRPVVMQMAEASARSGSASMPGEQQVDARVSVSFAIAN